MASDGNSVRRYLDKEAIRQAAVFAPGVLGMGNNPRLRSIVECAADALKVPVAAISIIDGERQWFPASIGFESDETARDLSSALTRSGRRSRPCLCPTPQPTPDLLPIRW